MIIFTIIILCLITLLKNMILLLKKNKTKKKQRKYNYSLDLIYIIIKLPQPDSSYILFTKLYRRSIIKSNVFYRVCCNKINLIAVNL